MVGQPVGVGHLVPQGDAVSRSLPPLVMAWQCPDCHHVGMASHRWMDGDFMGVLASGERARWFVILVVRECLECGAAVTADDWEGAP